MAGMLPKQPEDFYPIPGAKVAIISAMWHPPIYCSYDCANPYFVIVVGC